MKWWKVAFGGVSVAAGGLYDPGCPDDLDIFLLHDLSWSFENDRDNVYHQMPVVVDAFRQSFTDVRFGFGSFVDKPITPFGHREDYCYKMHQQFTTDLEAYRSELAEAKPKSGQDYKEAQLWGVVAAMTDPGLTWTEGEDPNAPRVMRVLVLSTDTWYHEAPDADSIAPDHGFITHPGDFSAECDVHDYPSIAQVAEALLAHKTRVIFLTTKEVRWKYQSLLDELIELGVEGAVATIEADSSDFGEKLIATVDSFSCDVTTAEPTSTSGPIECVYDVAHLLDNSWSYHSSYDNMKARMKRVTDHLYEYYQGSHTGLASFVDKPFAPFGYENYDYCYHLHQPMTDDVHFIHTVYDTIERKSGFDFRENQFAGIIKTVFDPGMAWREESGDYRLLVKVVLVTTDAWAHQLGDWKDGVFPTVRFGADCMVEDYPSVDHLGQALLSTDTAVCFIVPTQWNSYYQDIADQLVALGVTAVVETVDPQMKNLDVAAERGIKRASPKCITDLP